jgi:hypothetical protein
MKNPKITGSTFAKEVLSWALDFEFVLMMLDYLNYFIWFN